MKEALLGPCRSAVLKQGLFLLADQDLLNKAINAAVAARKEWDLWPVQKRAEIFFKAADMLSGPRRAEVLAKTMIGQVRYFGGGCLLVAMLHLQLLVRHGPLLNQ